MLASCGIAQAILPRTSVQQRPRPQVAAPNAQRLFPARLSNPTGLFTSSKNVPPAKPNVACQVAAKPIPAYLAPPDAYQNIVNSGAKKALLSPLKTFIMACVAGVFISFGAILALSVGLSCPGMASTNPGLQKILLGLFGLPFGLILVVNTGVELFTGNTAALSAAVLEGKANMNQLSKNWICSFFGNLAGCLFMVWAMSASGLTGTATPAMAVAAAKTSLTFTEAFLRGIFANWLVCLAVWLASSTSSMSGKLLSIVTVISAFVAMGFEHSVANMFFIPFGLGFANSGLTFGVFWEFVATNLIPVTLGNIVGGAFCVGALSSFFYGKLGQ